MQIQNQSVVKLFRSFPPDVTDLPQASRAVSLSSLCTDQPSPTFYIPSHIVRHITGDRKRV